MRRPSRWGGSRRSTPPRAPCSGCSACRSCMCRPRAAAPRARSCCGRCPTRLRRSCVRWRDCPIRSPATCPSGGAALLLSFVGAIVTFAGFSLVRDGDRLRIRRGLLARRAASVPLSRVHAVDVVEGVLRRPFGLASVRMETAGYRSEAAAAQTLLPLVRARDVPRLLAEFVPALAEEAQAAAAGEAEATAAGGRPPPLEHPPARAARRYALPPAVAGAALGAALTVFVPAAWPAVP